MKQGENLENSRTLSLIADVRPSLELESASLTHRCCRPSSVFVIWGSSRLRNWDQKLR